jgi:uncharacterized membrane protein (DUF441 family)
MNMPIVQGSPRETIILTASAVFSWLLAADTVSKAIPYLQAVSLFLGAILTFGAILSMIVGAIRGKQHRETLDMLNSAIAILSAHGRQIDNIEARCAQGCYAAPKKER